MSSTLTDDSFWEFSGVTIYAYANVVDGYLVSDQLSTSGTVYFNNNSNQVVAGSINVTGSLITSYTILTAGGIGFAGSGSISTNIVTGSNAWSIGQSDDSQVLTW